jgi:uncharacterized protein (DUF1697 family)
VALLRAINTPPRHVKMQRLRDLFSDMGLHNVATIIASGNVVFDTDRHGDLVGEIESALARGLGFEVPTFLFTADEFIDVIARTPFDERDGAIEVSLLQAAPGAAAAEAVERSVGGIDRLVVDGRAVYWLRAGPRDESRHSEQRLIGLLGMPTTRRALRTLHRIRDNHL